MDGMGNEEEAAAHTRFTVIDAESIEVSTYDNTLQAYSSDEYRTLLQKAGFSDIELLPAWGESKIQASAPLMLLRAVKE